jgi:hypothetical protein
MTNSISERSLEPCNGFMELNKMNEWIVVPSMPRSSSCFLSFRFPCKCSQTTSRSHVKWHRCADVLGLHSLLPYCWLDSVPRRPVTSLTVNQLSGCATISQLPWQHSYCPFICFCWFSQFLSGSDLLVQHYKEPSKEVFCFIEYDRRH